VPNSRLSSIRQMAWIALAGLLLGGLAAFALVPDGLSRLLGNKAPDVRSVGRALVGGPFALTDHTGRAVTHEAFRGKHMLVLFGFTHCPDICPSGLQVMSAALQEIGPLAERVTPIFITVDPERDTPAQLASYVPSFHPRLVGLTGSAAAIADVAKAYRVYFKKVKDEKSTAEYTVDHTALIYLMDARGEYVTHFNHATPVAQMAERLRKLLRDP
jgi:cytochrome oxidase Cu insertion factor (SCO1/SenC/PrrC family)